MVSRHEHRGYPLSCSCPRYPRGRAGQGSRGVDHGVSSVMSVVTGRGGASAGTSSRPRLARLTAAPDISMRLRAAPFTSTRSGFVSRRSFAEQSRDQLDALDVVEEPPPVEDPIDVGGLWRRVLGKCPGFRPVCFGDTVFLGIFWRSTRPSPPIAQCRICSRSLTPDGAISPVVRTFERLKRTAAIPLSHGSNPARDPNARRSFTHPATRRGPRPRLPPLPRRPA